MGLRTNFKPIFPYGLKNMLKDVDLYVFCCKEVLTLKQLFNKNDEIISPFLNTLLLCIIK